MKYEVIFSMCHCETTEVELDEEDVEGKSEGEIEALVESLAWSQIRREHRDYEPDEIIEMERIDD